MLFCGLHNAAFVSLYAHKILFGDQSGRLIEVRVEIYFSNSYFQWLTCMFWAIWVRTVEFWYWTVLSKILFIDMLVAHILAQNMECLIWVKSLISNALLCSVVYDLLYVILYLYNEVVAGILVSCRPSVIPCPLCSAYSSGWIHFIFI